MRRLLILRRHLALDRTDEYLRAWEEVRRAVERAGARAWLFRGAAHEDQYLEFIEWQEDSSPPLADAQVTEALTLLDLFAVARPVEEWEQAP